METYSVVRVIGEGSFGRAVLVRCQNTQDQYVVKEIQLPKSRSKVENRRKEVVLLSRMKHPNIVAFRDAVEADGLLCIVMEYCSGGDLLQRIQQQKPDQFRVDDILKWFAQMCAGAKHVHDKRVLHRDLKSKASTSVLASRRLAVICVVCSDVWSLGCVLYELCTLRHPFQASSWRSLILKVCRGAYPALPSHLPYELHHLVKQMFKTNPKDRPSLRTILASHRVSRLLRSHLPTQVTEEEQGRRTGRWSSEEGRRVASLLGNMSLIKTSTCEGGEGPREPASRKQWAAEPPATVLQVLASASLISSDSQTLAGSTPGGVPEEVRRRRWERGPPERLLGLLERAPVSRAFSTFLIQRGGEDPLVGPLSPPRGDDTDGPEPAPAEDEERTRPRSDDEDTDFEEDSPCDWMDEVEKMLTAKVHASPE